MIYSGDETYPDDITSGPAHDPLDEECPACGAEPGEPCRQVCPSRWN